MLFENLRFVGILVFLCEYISFLVVLCMGIVIYDIEVFYYFVCMVMVKDECNFDKFDCVFVVMFEGLFEIFVEDVLEVVDIFEEWLCKMVEKYFSFEEKVEIEVLGGFEKFMEILKEWFKD